MSEDGRPPAEPIQLPLEGGSAGAALTLRPLLCAVMRGPPGWFEREPGRGAALKALGIGVPADSVADVPIVAFLLEHPQAGLVLIDTGFHRSIAAGPSGERGRNLGLFGRLMARGTRMEPEQSVVGQLQALGIAASDIGLIVMTHMHFDHASALCDFPGTTVLVTREEWQAAWGPAPFMHGYVRHQIARGPAYRTFEFPPAASPSSAAGSTADPDGASPLKRTVDVFGDGSLTLAFTPGHTEGHLSVIARLRDRHALIGGDAFYTLATLRGDARPWLCEDREAFERSLGQLAAWDRANPGAVVVPGHDMDAWEKLDTLYS